MESDKKETAVYESVEHVIDEVEKIIIGKTEQIRLILAAILAEGHVLLEDMPGVGKTTLVKTLAQVLGCGFRRIQFTPDLMPSDIIGMNIYNQKTGEFQLMPGPVMTQILLADEINRAVPRTQSALLEAMEERQVTIDGQTYPLSQPFVVMATQNPIETAGTFILPEAQMDRFLMKISVGYPSLEEERQMLANLGDEMPFSTVNTVLEPLTIRSLISACQHVHISEHVMAYIVTLVQATRNHPQIRFGASPRASRALYKAAKAWAAMHQRAYVTPDDVQQLAAPVLAHRIALKRETTLSGLNSEGVIRAIIASIPVPTHREATLHA